MNTLSSLYGVQVLCGRMEHGQPDLTASSQRRSQELRVTDQPSDQCCGKHMEVVDFSKKLSVNWAVAEFEHLSVRLVDFKKLNHNPFI